MAGGDPHNPPAATPADPAAAGAAWAATVQAMRAKAAGIDWSKVDWSKLSAKDIGVQFGPVMTEEQFREYRKRQADRPVTVIRHTADGGGDKR